MARTSMFSSHRRTAFTAIAAGVAVVAAAWPGAGGTDHPSLFLPAPAGTEWEIAAGYNTATHVGEDPHAIDIVRADGPTADTPVLAPIAGRVTSVTSGSSCIIIRDSHGLLVMMCHVFPVEGLRSGANVRPGDRIGTVAPAGMAANNGLAHIHLALHRGFGGSQTQTIPFTGQYALERRDLSAVDTLNAYAGERFTSSVSPGPPATTSPAPVLPPGSSVTPNGLYTSGLNSAVVLGGGDAAAIAAKIAADSGRPVRALWMLSGGRWLYFLPSNPGVDGGLRTLPTTPLSVFVVIG